MALDLIVAIPLPAVLMYYSLLNRDAVEKSFEFSEKKLPTF